MSFGVIPEDSVYFQYKATAVSYLENSILSTLYHGEDDISSTVCASSLYAMLGDVSSWASGSQLTQTRYSKIQPGAARHWEFILCGRDQTQNPMGQLRRACTCTVCDAEYYPPEHPSLDASLRFTCCTHGLLEAAIKHQQHHAWFRHVPPEESSGPADLVRFVLSAILYTLTIIYLATSNPGGGNQEVASTAWEIALNSTGAAIFNDLRKFDILSKSHITPPSSMHHLTPPHAQWLTSVAHGSPTHSTAPSEASRSRRTCALVMHTSSFCYGSPLPIQPIE